MWILWWLEHIVFLVCGMVLFTVYRLEGVPGVLNAIIKVVKKLPGVQELIQNVLSKEVRTFTDKQAGVKTGARPPKVKIPDKGVASEVLLEEMKTAKSGDIDPSSGKIFAYVYTGDGDNFELQQKAYDMFTEKTGISADKEQVVREFHHAFMHENALNPMVFPSLRRFEIETISMASDMLNGDDEVVGSLTSGGTESILMAMKTYRDRARKMWPLIKNPEMVAPITIHPAHEKAAHYFGFTIRHVPVGEDFRPDMRAYEQAITPDTIALLCSAPQYCHGVVDPVEEIARLALARGLPLHVDACFGGFMLPWVEKLGYSVPLWDFRVPGVTSISADIHKYGFGAKGSSVIVYRNAELRKHQIFAYSRWPGGLFGSPSMAGTRPGGSIAGAWATLKSMGKDGYLKMGEQLMSTTVSLKEGINQIPGLRILGTPHMTAFAIGSTDPDVNILAVADEVEKGGWKVERQQYPASLHCTIMPHHTAVVKDLLDALKEATQSVKSNKGSKSGGDAAMYGMVAKMPDKSIIDEFVVEFFSEVYI